MRNSSERDESLKGIVVLGLLTLILMPGMAVVMPELRSDPVFLGGAGLLALLFIAWVIVGLTSITQNPVSPAGRLLCLEFTPTVQLGLFTLCFLLGGVLQGDLLRLALGLFGVYVLFHFKSRVG